MVEEIAFENGSISNFHGLVTLTLDRVILHTIVHHSSTSTYTLNFTEIKETFCGRMNVCTHGWMDGRTFEIHFISRVDLKILKPHFSTFSYSLCTEHEMTCG